MLMHFEWRLSESGDQESASIRHFDAMSDGGEIVAVNLTEMADCFFRRAQDEPTERPGPSAPVTPP